MRIESTKKENEPRSYNTDTDPNELVSALKDEEVITLSFEGKSITVTAKITDTTIKVYDQKQKNNCYVSFDRQSYEVHKKTPKKLRNKGFSKKMTSLLLALAQDLEGSIRARGKIRYANKNILASVLARAWTPKLESLTGQQIKYYKLTTSDIDTLKYIGGTDLDKLPPYLSIESDLSKEVTEPDKQPLTKKLLERLSQIRGNK